MVPRFPSRYPVFPRGTSFDIRITPIGDLVRRPSIDGGASIDGYLWEIRGSDEVDYPALIKCRWGGSATSEHSKYTERDLDTASAIQSRPRVKALIAITFLNLILNILLHEKKCDKKVRLGEMCVRG